MLNKRSYKLIKIVKDENYYIKSSEVVVKHTENFKTLEYVCKFTQPYLKSNESLIAQTYINNKLVESIGMEVY